MKMNNNFGIMSFNDYESYCCSHDYKFQFTAPIDQVLSSYCDVMYCSIMEVINSEGLYRYSKPQIENLLRSYFIFHDPDICESAILIAMNFEVSQVIIQVKKSECSDKDLILSILSRYINNSLPNIHKGELCDGYKNNFHSINLVPSIFEFIKDKSGKLRNIIRYPNSLFCQGISYKEKSLVFASYSELLYEDLNEYPNLLYLIKFINIKI